MDKELLHDLKNPSAPSRPYVSLGERARQAAREIEKLQAELGEMQEWASKVGHTIGFAQGAAIGTDLPRWAALGRAILSRLHERNEELNKLRGIHGQITPEEK